MKAISICFLIMICFVGTVNAQLYKWVDEEGVTHYSNKRPPLNQNIETIPEIRSSQSNNRKNVELDQLINSYKKDSLQENSINFQSNDYRSTVGPDKNRLEDYEKEIKHREWIVDRCKDDLREVQRTPHTNSEYRSHKKKLTYYEARLERARSNLEDAKREYEDYKRVQ